MCHGACHIITYSPVLNHHLFCALFPTNLFLLLVRISWQDVPRMLSSSSLDLRHISFRSQLTCYLLRDCDHPDYSGFFLGLTLFPLKH